MNDDIRNLEEKIAYLERHVTEQDRAMLEFAEELAQLRREMKALRDSMAPRGGAGEEGGDYPSDERPPHY